MTNVPVFRVSPCNAAPARPERDYVLYWMTATRRPRYNFGLQHAVEMARKYGVGLVVFEPLRCDYPWACDRIHKFIIEGMRANRDAFAKTRVQYLPYVERAKGDGKGLLKTLAERAAHVVTDDFPCFFLPHMIESAANQLDVRLEKVDSNGLIPLCAPGREFTVAHSFRRWLQKNLPTWLPLAPKKFPLRGTRLPSVSLPKSLLKRYGDLDDLDLSGLPIDHSVGPGYWPGGFAACEANRAPWFERGFTRFAEDHNHPHLDNTSNLSPWLHFGHVSVWDVIEWMRLMDDLQPENLASNPKAGRDWWNLSANGNALMEQLVVWRELSYLWCHNQPEDYRRFDSLPEWALLTLKRHADDPRPHIYTLEQFEQAETHDELWNAAQRQLVVEGRMHNYLRMLWGKKILNWTESPQQALDFMIHLNNKYALDGRDPNSYSGITWCLGRFDRAWGPERPIFGTVRFMTSNSTRRKTRVDDYLKRYGRNA